MRVALGEERRLLFFLFFLKLATITTLGNSICD